MYGSFLFLVPWVPFDNNNVQTGESLEVTKSSSDITRPSLYTVHTIATSAEFFSRSLGGITLQNLYPYQKYKIRVAARNTLGVGRFSSDVMVSMVHLLP